MNKFRRNSICQLLSFLAVMMFVVTSAPATLFAGESASSGTVKSMTKINYKPIKYFVSGKRIRIVADVTDPEGIKLVRCYFKGKEQADFVFVSMTPGSSTYTAILPAAGQTASSIDYLFLAVNNKNQVIKTQQFSVKKEDRKQAPPWQDVAMDGQLTVSTELAEAPAVLEGFADSIAMNVVESVERFGFVAGIYTATQVAAAGGATGTAATATSAGTVAAGVGLSTAAIVGVAAGVAAVGVVGGAVAAGGGGGGGGGTSTTTCTMGSVGSYATSGSCAYATVNISGGCLSCSWIQAWACGSTVYYKTSNGYTSASCASSDQTCINNIAAATVNNCQ